MKQTQKTQGKLYVTPATELLQLQASSILEGSKTFTINKGSGNQTSDQWTRKQNGGYGSGLWEDMQ